MQDVSGPSSYIQYGQGAAALRYANHRDVCIPAVCCTAAARMCTPDV